MFLQNDAGQNLLQIVVPHCRRPAHLGEVARSVGVDPLEESQLVGDELQGQDPDEGGEAVVGGDHDRVAVQPFRQLQKKSCRQSRAHRMDGAWGGGEAGKTEEMSRDEGAGSTREELGGGGVTAEKKRRGVGPEASFSHAFLILPPQHLVLLGRSTRRRARFQERPPASHCLESYSPRRKRLVLLLRRGRRQRARIRTTPFVEHITHQLTAGLSVMTMTSAPRALTSIPAVRIWCECSSSRMSMMTGVDPDGP